MFKLRSDRTAPEAARIRVGTGQIVGHGGLRVEDRQQSAAFGGVLASPDPMIGGEHRQRRGIGQFSEGVEIVLHNKTGMRDLLHAKLIPEADLGEQQDALSLQLFEPNAFMPGQRVGMRHYQKQLF